MDVFTGGYFKIENDTISFGCRNKKVHKKVPAYTRTFLIKTMNSELSRYSSYLTSGIRCTEAYCYNTYENENGDESILLDPPRVQGLINLREIGADATELASYLRYWGFLQETKDDTFGISNKIRSLEDGNFCKIKEIKTDNYYSKQAKELLGRYVFTSDKIMDVTAKNAMAISSSVCFSFHTNYPDPTFKYNVDSNSFWFYGNNIVFENILPIKN